MAAQQHSAARVPAAEATSSGANDPPAGRGSVRRDVVLLGAVALLVTGANIAWTALNTRPPHWDMARHLWSSLEYGTYLAAHDWGRFLTGWQYYPPLVYWLTQPFYAVLGTDMRVAIFSNVVFLFILTLSVYRIGVELHDQRTGRMAAIVALSLPIVVSQFKEYQLDAPLTAMVALALLLLIRSHGFSVRRETILFGLVVGAGLLTKWTFMLVIAAPVAFAVLGAARQGRFRPMLGALAVALLVAGPWYLSNFASLRTDLLTASREIGIQEGDPPVVSIASLVWYPTRLVQDHLYLIPTVLLVVGLVRWDRRNIYPLLLLIGSVAAFTVIHNKDTRYLLPATAGIAVLATSWLPRRWWVEPAVVAYAVVAFLLVSFGSTLLPAEVRLGPVVVAAQHGYIIGPPVRENWQVEAVVADVAKRWPGGTISYEGPETIWANAWDVRYYGKRYGLAYDEDDPDATVTRGAVGVRLPDGTALRIQPRR